MRTVAGVRLTDARFGLDDSRLSGGSSSPFDDLGRAGRLGPGTLSKEIGPEVWEALTTYTRRS